MSVMFEVYYGPPRDIDKERRLTEQVEALGGWLDFWEQGEIPGLNYICLTFEFDARPQAEKAAEILRQQGEHVEAVCDYGD
jgi:hypothetical protein